MCIVNPALVDDILPVVGKQAEIMGKVGISWNSWIKIVGGQPIRHSLGERFRARILADADDIEGFRCKFPSGRGEVDTVALEDAFLLPA